MVLFRQLAQWLPGSGRSNSYKCTKYKKLHKYFLGTLM